MFFFFPPFFFLLFFLRSTAKKTRNKKKLTVNKTFLSLSSLPPTPSHSTLPGFSHAAAALRAFDSLTRPGRELVRDTWLDVNER